MNLECEELITLNEFGFQKILDDFQNTDTINILTYNISTKKNELLSILKELENKTIIIVTNIPQRWERYYSDNPRNKAFIQIKEYLSLLDPDEFKSNVEIYFNFQNHAKVYSTDNYTYIGSQNFSDESKNNYECGVIITSNCGEDIIENIKEESIRFFGVEIEDFKNELQEDIKKTEKIIDKFDYSVDFEITSDIDFLEEVKYNFTKLKELLEVKIKQKIDRVETKIRKIKEKYYLQDVTWIENSLIKLEDINETIDTIIWEISEKGDFAEVYFNYEQEAMENVSWADEEHLEDALTSEMRDMENICFDIKERYEKRIKDYFDNINEKFNCVMKLYETIEDMTSNREVINNAGL
ncbi:MAG: hypothetical protein ACRC6E_14685 [Fusobacteriaceae bacterium]